MKKENKMKTLKEIKKLEDVKKEIEVDGFSELRDGLYLSSQKNIIEEQKIWYEEDQFKSLDFTRDDFWITTDDAGMAPKSFSSIDEVFEVYGEYTIISRESGDIIDTYLNEQQAGAQIKKYEEMDKKDGIYTANFYEILKTF